MAFACLCFGCASGLKRSEGPVPPPREHGRTVALFLVDGLSAKTLQSALEKGLMPSTRRFFLQQQSSFALGRAAFPSLTYPNLSAILTTRKVGEMPVISNHVLDANGKLLNFELAKFHPQLRERVDSISVIDQLEKSGRETATFSYVFGLNARNHMRVGIREGLDYSRHDYQKLDNRLIENLEEFLLGRKNPATWPEFIYVHLIGVDALSHTHGPRSPEVRAYLAWLDSRLAKTYRLLAAADRSQHSVVSLLTADHGFTETNRHVRLGKIIQKSDLGLVATNESRFVGLYLPEGQSHDELRELLSEIRKINGVEFTVMRQQNLLEVANRKSSFYFEMGPAVCAGEVGSLALQESINSSIAPAAAGFRCPSEFDSASSPYPFLISDVARFFSAPSRPDALIMAGRGVSFAAGTKGGHGGPSAEEMLVPVLTRNARLSGNGPVPTSDLLKILTGLGSAEE